MIVLTRNIVFSPDRNGNLEILNSGINFTEAVNISVTHSFLFVF